MQRTLTASLIALAFSILVAAPLASAHIDNPAFEFWMSSDSGVATDHTMYQNDMLHDGFDVTIANGDTRVWEADMPALVDVAIGGSGHVFTLTLLIKQGANLVADIGIVHASGAFDSCEMHAVSQGVAGPVLLPAPVQSVTVRNVNIVFTPDASCIAHAGDRLGIRIQATGNTVIIGTSDVNVPIAQGILAPKERSHLHTNFVAPNYPTPELPSLLLAGAGLGTVALVIARRK